MRSNLRLSRGSGATLAAFAVLVLLRALTTPPWPDDWDGVGFVEAVTRFDLDHFVPHPPGYPVYVVLLRGASLLTTDPIRAANGVAIASGLAAIAFLAIAAARVFGATRAAWVAAFVALAPLVWRASTAIGSEAPALAFACAAVFGATLTARPRAAAWWIGVSVGLGLGVRLSWSPLFVPMIALAPAGRRWSALFIAGLATFAWCVPFIALVGAKHLLALARTHAVGHFEVWGGSAIREPGAKRGVWLARDLFVDGIGMDRDALGIAIAAGFLVLGCLGLRAWRASGYPNARLALVVFVPYLTWIAVGQNLHQQPRHALPLVVGLACAVALAATTSPRALRLGGAVLALVAIRTGMDAYARRTIPPPGEQLVELARATPRTAVFGGPSARFAELDPTAVGRTVATIGEVRLAVSRLPSLPARVLVTSELEDLAQSSYPLVPVATLCRPARVDRRAPCIDVLEWKAPFLRR